MDIGSVFLILALILLIGLYIARPLVERKAIAVTHEDQEASALLAEKDRVLIAIQELDFDHDLGKIPEADYPVQRASLVQKGIDVLRQLDQFQTESQVGEAEARLEATIAARRIAGVSPRLAQNGNGKPDDELETLIAARRREQQSRSAGFCPQCGRPVQKADRYCPNCGKVLA